MKMDNRISTASRSESIPLSDDTLKKFGVAKVFRGNFNIVNNIDFSPSGDTLISSSLDDKIVLYDCKQGLQKTTLFSRKYGVDLINFTHAENAVIHCSTKIDDTIRYLSLHDNKYIRYFVGHTKKVNALTMSPINDTFLTASLDETLRMWDLRSPNCEAVMAFNGEALTAFDPEGLIFAAGTNNESVRLYDARSFSKGPFMHFILPYGDKRRWSSLKFSPNGKIIMINTYGSFIGLIDSFTGVPLRCLLGHCNMQNRSLEASFSPDSRYVVSGSSDGEIHAWNIERGNKICSFDAKHPGAVCCVKFNPKYLMMATACYNMAFWLPEPKGF